MQRNFHGISKSRSCCTKKQSNSPPPPRTRPLKRMYIWPTRFIKWVHKKQKERQPAIKKPSFEFMQLAKITSKWCFVRISYGFWRYAVRRPICRTDPWIYCCKWHQTWNNSNCSMGPSIMFEAALRGHMWKCFGRYVSVRVLPPPTPSQKCVTLVTMETRVAHVV